MVARNLIARVELLSDIHIGTGTELTRDIDWIAPGDGFVYVANTDRLLEEVFARAEADGKDMRQVAKVLASSTLASLREMGWLTKEDFGPEHRLFLYRLRGAPATVAVREQIKDVHGRPYLPGSSLKGSLRTVLARALAGSLTPPVHAIVEGEIARVDELRNQGKKVWLNKERADDLIDKKLFGNDPNHDLLRALQVGDSQSVSPKNLGLGRVHIYPSASNTFRGRSRGLDVDVEVLMRGTVLELPIHIPTELLTDRQTEFDHRRRGELGQWEQQAGWLERLARAGKLYDQAVLKDEFNFYQGRADAREAAVFLDDTIDLFSKLAKNEFLLVLGWGGGWHTKTLNHYIKADPRAFDRIVSRYKLNPTGTHKPGDPFPKSRHLLRKPNGQAGEPLGWVKVTLEAR